MSPNSSRMGGIWAFSSSVSGRKGRVVVSCSMTPMCLRAAFIPPKLAAFAPPALSYRSHFLGVYKLSVALAHSVSVSGLSGLPATRAGVWNQVGDSRNDSMHPNRSRVRYAERRTQETEQGNLALIAEDVELGEQFTRAGAVLDSYDGTFGGERGYGAGRDGGLDGLRDVIDPQRNSHAVAGVAVVVHEFVL